MKVFILASLLLLGVVVAGGDYPHKCDGPVNDKPIITTEPKIVATVKNGIKMQVDGIRYPIVHVYGTPEEMGQAYGELLKDDINNLYPEFWDFAATQAYDAVKKYIPFIPQSLFDKLIKPIIPHILDLQWWMVSGNVPSYFEDEFKGIAAGAGIDWNDAKRVSVFPELIRMQCSMIGAWGTATAKSTGGMVQLRALDWDITGPFAKYATVLIYHPSEGHGNTYAVWTWAGLVGALSGYSASRVGVSEKVQDSYHGMFSEIGEPTTFVMRDILNWDNTREDAIRRVFETKRTNAIWLGVGDKDAFNMMRYDHVDPIVYSDKNYTFYASHPEIEDTLYISKHVEPQDTTCMSYYLQQYHGSITPEIIIKYITAQVETGDTHIAVYDMANNYMYVSSCSADNTVMAYENQFLRLDMTKMFAEPHPSATETIAFEQELVVRSQ
eukprot:CAMPEP_0115003888 /NCGR_PEP_ID=MMETSP0216-20121206/18886_1 /TAXON_ID=223996 /ORGANISM="Protocruzia adherens, Strain Boccale" /LENGTH=438 /DNA_ID=CAMNT_0002369793 /DNA_START=35 /DNA_END=1351 /DNA_ORIENTATION=-